jgi:hypothetical protein
MKCEHEREKTRCRDCGGGSFCDHGIIRGTCSLCSTDQVFRRYEKQARDRQLRFNLTLAQFTEIVLRPCIFCGRYDFPRGVDRRDNFQGYTVGNCQPCCARCNRYKSDDSESVFLDHVLKIARHQEKLKAKLKIDQAKSAGVAPAHSPVFPLATNDGLPGALPEVS